MAKSKTSTSTSVLEVSAPNFRWAEFEIESVTPYCQNKFSAKGVQKMVADQEAGSTGKSRSKKEAKDFDMLYQGAIHKADDGWIGIPASAFRNAMISACRAAGVVMTRAKLAVYVEPDGFDAESGDPLVKITEGEPSRKDSTVRNANGSIDIRPRPVWKPGMKAVVRIRYDADMLTAENVGNLLQRAGLQVGIGEGRPDSKQSSGIGWGLFKLSGDEK